MIYTFSLPAPTKDQTMLEVWISRNGIRIMRWLTTRTMKDAIIKAESDVDRLNREAKGLKKSTSFSSKGNKAVFHGNPTISPERVK